jgi:predicted CXXCH cytochrome family protein
MLLTGVFVLVVAALNCAWTDPNCGSCHRMNNLFSHPVGVTPAMRVPASLPLDGGRMTCITCHWDDAAAHRQARAERSPMLRAELSGSNGCSACHERGDPSRSAQHSVLGLAHIPWARQGQKPAQGIGQAMTSQCLGCHDGLLTNDVWTGAAQVVGMGGPAHPVGVPYRSGAIRTAGHVQIRMTPLIGLDSRVQLFGGEVECLSCHSLYSRESKLLVMSNFHSRLCLSCHME